MHAIDDQNLPIKNKEQYSSGQYSSLRLIKNEESRKHCYRGIIIPISWDLNGAPLDFSLFMDSEEELILRPLTKFAKRPLEYYVNKEVIVCGETICDEIMYYSEVHPVTKKSTHRAFRRSGPKYDEEEHGLHIPEPYKTSILH